MKNYLLVAGKELTVVSCRLVARERASYRTQVSEYDAYGTGLVAEQIEEPSGVYDVSVEDIVLAETWKAIRRLCEKMSINWCSAWAVFSASIEGRVFVNAGSICAHRDGKISFYRGNNNTVFLPDHVSHEKLIRWERIIQTDPGAKVGYHDWLLEHGLFDRVAQLNVFDDTSVQNLAEVEDCPTPVEMPFRRRCRRKIVRVTLIWKDGRKQRF